MLNHTTDPKKGTTAMLARTIKLAAVVLCLSSTLALAESEDSIKSSEAGAVTGVSPLGYGGSDAASADFMKNVLPTIQSLINVNLREYTPLQASGAMKVDPGKLEVGNLSDARVYFVGEGAGYHNSIGLNLLTPGEKSDDKTQAAQSLTIFPDASSSVSYYDPASKIARTSSEPLLPGDFVDVKNIKSGTRLDFFLTAYGASGGTDKFTADPKRNPDGINHVVSFVVKNSPFLILAFEDMLGGGDKDYNDVIIAVNIGKANVSKMVGGPEPEFWAIMVGLVGVAFWWVRRHPVLQA